MDDGFAVALHLEGAAARPLGAVRSGSGIYYVRRLPGPSAPVPRPVILTVTDLRGRFLPVALRMTLPGEVPPVLRPDGPSLFRLALDSAPVRGDLPGLAVVRAHLWDEGGGRPAAYAQLAVEVSGATYSAGADDQGRACLALPYPVFRRGLKAGDAVSLYDHTWPLTVRVAYGGSPPPSVPGMGVPDLAAVRSQPPALLVLDPAEPAQQWNTRLPFGTELVLRSGEQPVLLVRTAGPAPKRGRKQVRPQE